MKQLSMRERWKMEGEDPIFVMTKEGKQVKISPKGKRTILNPKSKFYTADWTKE